MTNITSITVSYAIISANAPRTNCIFMSDLQFQTFDFLTSKSQLAVKIKCSHRSIHNYHEIARLFVDDFLSDYPTIGEKIITSHPLTIYQCWVLFRIHQFLKVIPKAELLKHSLEHDSRVQQQYSKAQFEATYPEITEEHPNNGIKAICRIA